MLLDVGAHRRQCEVGAGLKTRPYLPYLVNQYVTFTSTA